LRTTALAKKMFVGNSAGKEFAGKASADYRLTDLFAD
jgi:hypothetical protein